MSEIKKTEAAQQPSAPRFSRLPTRTDIIIIGLGIVVAVGLFVVLTNRANLRRDVTAAQAVSDKAITAIDKRDGAAARTLGTAKFKSTYTDRQLTDQFKAVEVATSQKPTLYQHYVSSGKSGKTIFFMYKYTRLKVPFYVRTAIVKTSANHWELSNISGNVNEANLLGQ